MEQPINHRQSLLSNKHVPEHKDQNAIEIAIAPLSSIEDDSLLRVKTQKATCGRRCCSKRCVLSLLCVISCLTAVLTPIYIDWVNLLHNSQPFPERFKLLAGENMTIRLISSGFMEGGSSFSHLSVESMHCGLAKLTLDPIATLDLDDSLSFGPGYNHLGMNATLQLAQSSPAVRRSLNAWITQDAEHGELQIQCVVSGRTSALRMPGGLQCLSITKCMTQSRMAGVT
jgi:hypothetical protein